MSYNSKNVLQALQAKVGSADWNAWEIRRWSFYDFVRYPVAGPVEINFFNVAQGGTDPNGTVKTKEQTNVPKSRSFGQVYYIIQQIRTYFQLLPKARQASGISTDADLLSTTYNDLAPAKNDILTQGVLKIDIGQKNYFTIEQPLLNCPPGFGLEVQQIGSTLVEDFNIHVQQSPFGADVYTLSPPQMIEPEQVIEAAIVYPSTGPALSSLINSTDVAVNIGLILDGYIARPAQ